MYLMSEMHHFHLNRIKIKYQHSIVVERFNIMRNVFRNRGKKYAQSIKASYSANSRCKPTSCQFIFEFEISINALQRHFHCSVTHLFT